MGVAGVVVDVTVEVVVVVVVGPPAICAAQHASSASFSFWPKIVIARMFTRRPAPGMEPRTLPA
jgi:hypothetical protein